MREICRQEMGEFDLWHLHLSNLLDEFDLLKIQESGTMFVPQETTRAIQIQGRNITTNLENIVAQESQFARTLVKKNKTIHLIALVPITILSILVALFLIFNVIRPLKTIEGQVGFLQVYFDTVQSFPPQQLNILWNFASQASLAISNARLYANTDQALSRRAQQLSILEKVGRELSAELDLDRLFDLILQFSAQNHVLVNGIFFVGCKFGLGLLQEVLCLPGHCTGSEKTTDKDQ